jgi:hypothetical protein
MTQIPDQASQALNANVARATYNVDGSGLIVGILSDSFDTSGNADTMASDIANGYLPADTQILQDMPGGEDEGRGMAQIVHEIAPGASILFATAAIGSGVIGEQNYAANILALAAAGAKVIVDDYIYFEEPSYQDGIVAQAIAQVVAQGVIYLSAASNDGANGYEAPFNAGSATITHAGRTDTLHDFAPGDHRLAVTFLAGQTGFTTFLLQWASPAASASPGNGATSDLDLYLVDGSGHVIASSQRNNIGGDPYEEFSVDLSTVSGTYYLEVGLHSGAAPADFRIIGSDNDGGVFATMDHLASSITQSTFFGHFASSDVIAVGAAKYTQTPAFGQTPPHKEPYSTVGPDYVYYDVDGNLLPTPEVRTIAVTGVDNADTSFFGGSDFDHDGFRNFSGTSAAAPSVAAVVALMLQANAALNSDDARHLLQDSAIKMPNPDATGAGLVQADRAVGFAATHTITAYPDGSDTLLGTHLADTFIGSAQGDVFIGYGGGDTFTGGGGADEFQDTAADLAGATITDFGFGDLINLTDLAFSANSTASFSVLTHTLTIDSHFGTTAQILLPNFSGGVFGLSQDATSGTDISLQMLVRLSGTDGDDTFAAASGNERIDAGAGTDTVSFDFKLTDASIAFSGNRVIVDGPASHTVLTGFEIYKFTDGSVNENDGNPLIDNLFYDSHYHDVWAAHVDPDAHYASYGWREGRDPNAFFSTSGYLATYTDVKAAGINPLVHYDQYGWKEGRDPSTDFDTKSYLANNPDVAAAGVDPLLHFLQHGAAEGRAPVADGVWG